MKIPRLVAEPPLGLAALRIALGVVILVPPALWQAPHWAGLSADLRFAPEGLGWALQIIPIDPYIARVAQVLLIVSCAAAICGLGSRLAMLGVTLFGLYVFGLSQLSGAVIHNMHLFWFSALLAVSPSGDALSLLHRSRRQPPAVPRRFSRWGLVKRGPGYQASRSDERAARVAQARRRRSVADAALEVTGTTSP